MNRQLIYGIMYLGGLFLFGRPLLAQESLKPLGVFDRDTLEIGLPVYYSLSVRHRPETRVIFPDSSYSFDPFELVGRQFFDTRTSAQGSLDSVVYRLTSFETQSVQTLSLPVFLITPKDCVQYRPRRDTLFFKARIEQDPRNYTFQSDTRYVDVPSRFDIALFLSAILGLVLILLLVWGFFGKAIQRFLLLYRLETGHRVYVREFQQLSERSVSNASIFSLERAVTRWKKHMEQITDKPFSTYTSKEIREIVPDPKLARSLKEIDRAVYGQEFSGALSEALEVLLAFSEEQFSQKRETLRNEA